MPAYHISGPSGSGKSTIGRVLRERGFRIIDTDFEEGLSAWVDNATGKEVSEMPAPPYTKEWMGTHSWLWNKIRMNELISGVSVDPIFVCGRAQNEKEFYGSFKKRFGLCVDGDTLVKRLVREAPERWVVGLPELNEQIEGNKSFKQSCIDTGAILINGLLPPDQIADIILQNI